MWGKLLAGLLASCVLAVGLVEASAARAERCLANRCGGPLVSVKPTVGGVVAPKALPRRQLAPAALRLFLAVATVDGTHPSALREARIRSDRDIEIDARGLPPCGYRAMVASRTRATRVCRGALVGSGSARVLSDANETMDTGRIEVGLFHGRTGDGGTILFARALSGNFGARPLLARIEITDRRSGRYGSLIRIQVPRLGDGLGSLAYLDLEMRRTFAQEGRRTSLIGARCPDGALRFDVPKMVFRNEAKVPGVPPRTVIEDGLVVPCTPRG